MDGESPIQAVNDAELPRRCTEQERIRKKTRDTIEEKKEAEGHLGDMDALCQGAYMGSSFCARVVFVAHASRRPGVQQMLHDVDMMTYELLHTNASTDSNPDRVHVQETGADVLYVRY